MIPSSFDYVGVESVDEALSVLNKAGDDAKILAGGHSLLPLMKLRLAAPSLIVDLGRVASLRYIRQEDGFLAIGAMTRYVDLKTSSLVQQEAPLLSQTSGLVGDAQVRNRGTLGGALAHADPAGDIPTAITALDGVIDVISVRGTRSIPVDGFFRDLFESTIEPDEILTCVRIPAKRTAAQHYEKFRRRMCDWAIVGVAVSLDIDEAAEVSSARVALTNVGPTTLRATATEQHLVGCPLSSEEFQRAAEHAAEGLDPTPELNAPAEYKKHIVRVMTARALNKAVANHGAA